MGEKDKIEIYQDKKGEWRWRRKASNGKIVGASSEGYSDKKACEENANRPAGKDKWEFYQDKRGEWRWRRKASNGKIVGSSSEGYNEKKACEDNARRLGWKG